MDGLFEQMANISKAHAYDIVSKQVQELKAENEALRQSNSELKIVISELISHFDEESETFFHAKREAIRRANEILINK